MTKRQFATWFREQVQPRWPTWQVNPCLLGDWCEALARYNTDTLTKAIRLHRIREDLSRPRISKVVAIARELNAAAAPRRVACPRPPDVVTAAEFWERVRTTFPRHERLKLMRALVKFHRDPRSEDPEAYDWLMEETSGSGPAASAAEEGACQPVGSAVSAVWDAGLEPDS
jgi:hypothetical protein